MVLNKIMVTAGITTLLQAAGQLVFTALSIAQYFCLIDFLRELPLLLYIKILYFHNPETCGTRINIGQSIDGIANQAFVLITNLPIQTFRTFIINCTSLGLSVLWIITSVVIILGGAKNKQSKAMRWPWIIVTVAICGVDLVAAVIYANESFHTRTLSDIMDLINGVSSGTSNTELDTSWASWIMVLLYSRFVVLFVLNVFLLILVIVSLNMKPETKTDVLELEAPTPILNAPPAVQVSTGVQSSPIPTPPLPTVPTAQDSSERYEETVSVLSEVQPTTRIPRAGFSKSFQRMKSFLFSKSPSPEVHQRRSPPESVLVSPEISPRAQHVDMKRTVNFPKSLLSLPQRLENIIAEQQRRLDRSVIDTSGRNSPPRASQSMPQLDTTSTAPTDGRGRRGTTAELQGQLPWAYIPAPAHRMRDQLPPDEDLPPVPLPDYTALQPVKKASVHRAASSLSSLTQRKDYVASQSLRLPRVKTMTN
ncbi:unnamed protein product [Arctia plantaginis]|uniref:Uncharacterized protein n=1 Tax=Arctia plantaginis TaxID=874455 RepID=A0A8S0Z1P2_ARCPL|nr:unnamed protein product [Arctia plantaginis]